MIKKATTGNRGKGIRSDCYIELELTEKGGIQLEIKSKVGKLFGKQIDEFCRKVLQHFEIENCVMNVEDTGALEYIMAARIEAAVKQLKKTEIVFLPELLPQNVYITDKEKYRRSRLYLPGNTPKLALNAGIHNPDGVILDLEDSVAITKKAEASILVRNALRAVDFYGAERMVRINQIPMGLDDLEFVIPNYVNLILFPKCESSAQIDEVNTCIAAIQKKHDLDYPVHLMPIIESAKGVMNVMQIAGSKNVVALAIGLEDYTADLGVQRTKEGTESFFARCHLVNAAKAAGIQAIDSVFSDVGDMEALKHNVLISKSLGFDGMGCIHPRQIKVIHENFAPNTAEIEKAKKIVNAFYEATAKGLGVVSLGSKMIDPPVVKRAQTTIEMAIQVGKLAENWRDNNEC